MCLYTFNWLKETVANSKLEIIAWKCYNDGLDIDSLSLTSEERKSWRAQIAKALPLVSRSGHIPETLVKELKAMVCFGARPYLTLNLISNIF